MKTTKKARDYQAKYQATPEEVDKRVARNKARRHAIAAGKAAVGDGKDIDHKRPLDAGGGHGDGNTRVADRKDNRGWRKDKPGMYGGKK